MTPRACMCRSRLGPASSGMFPARSASPGRRANARRWSSLVRLCVGVGICVLTAVVAPAAPADDTADPAALRAAMERAYVAAEADHAKARRDGFAARLEDFATVLRDAVAAAAATPPADAKARAAAIAAAAKTLAAAVSAPFSETSLRVVLAEMLPPDLTAWPKSDRAETVRDAFLAATKAVFAAEKFPDCWDARFLGLPEVAAWRSAHETKPTPPVQTPDPKPEVPPERVPDTAPVIPPTPRADTELPSPFATDPAVNLVAVDRTRGWVGPWSGWTQEIPERDNHRQRRPAKFVYFERYETTCADYLRFLKGVDAPKRRALLPVGWTVDEKDEPSCPPGRERFPVTNVTWFQAQAYAESRGERLPTEDEWDRAAGGGEKEPRSYPWGAATAGKLWAFGGQGADAPVAVDAFPDDRTAEGIVGLAGNVSEMVATLADRREIPAKLQPSQQVVVRGGSWRTPREAECSTTYRWVIDAGQPSPSVGFRCVMDEAEYRKRFK